MAEAWEENVFHIFQGGTGKQQLATDENKMLGNEEIRNIKELELIKSMIKALLFFFKKKTALFKRDQWLRTGQNKVESTKLNTL